MPQRLASVLIIASLAVLLAWSPAPVWAGSYADSAHGDQQSGVKRQALGEPRIARRAIGSCAHCHDKQASPASGGADADGPSLFAPNFNRSRQLGPYQVSALSLGDYDYSRNFGGLPSGGPTSIFEAFNQPAGGPESSYHNLYDVWKSAQKFSGFGFSSSPCSACHNVHRARRSGANPGDPRYSSISLPTEHESLWGDQVAETMASYAGRYQPPLYAGGAGGYEPGGVGVTFADGSQQPDYVRFCQSCHQMPLYSTSRAGQVKRIDWSSHGGDAPMAGDKHGMNGFTQALQAVAPYTEIDHMATDYLLACSDCHEPHGSPNASLIRRGVNGSALKGVVAAAPASNSLGYLCRQCHADDYTARGKVDNRLVNRWEDVHHTAADRPYPPGSETNCRTCHDLGAEPLPIGCGYCHGHGSYVDASHPGTLPNGKRIPAPEGGSRKTF